MSPGLKEVIETLRALHLHIPAWLEIVIIVLLILTFVAPGIYLIGKFTSGMIKAARSLARSLFGSADEKRRAKRRRQYAEWIESQLRDLNAREEWRDKRFAELEARVEVRDAAASLPILPLVGRSFSQSSLRQEKSLSRALAKSKHRLALVQGDPGSGKSVALRHVALRLARRGMQGVRSRSTTSLLPIYVNLKHLHRGERPVDAKLIEQFVASSLRIGATSELDRFLDEEYALGVESGSWFFLFDSFDEIPELLSSTDIDETVKQYSEAVSNFLYGMSDCHGIVASRYFRGPVGMEWPTYRILPLSTRRRKQAIKKATLSQQAESLLLGRLEAADQGIIAMSWNPLFLGLLCEYVRDTGDFPNSSHAVYEAYVGRRLDRDAERVEQRFSITASTLRAAAEELAFTMTAEKSLGLVPRRAALVQAVVEPGRLTANIAISSMDALEYVRLARKEQSSVPENEQTFTFAHRRFQEYFATCGLLREADRVTPHEVLLSDKWRETAVTMLQTQVAAVYRPLVSEAKALLSDAAAEVRSLGESGFSWPPRVLHILGVLQSGLATAQTPLPQELSGLTDQLLLAAYDHGQIQDKKWALEVAGTATGEVLERLLRNAFRGRSGWLRDVAYRQAARLATLPEDLAAELRLSLVILCARGAIHRDWRSFRAQVAGLPNPRPFMDSLRLLWLAPVVDIAVHIVLLIFLLAAMTWQAPMVSLVASLIIFIALLCSAATFRPTVLYASSRVHQRRKPQGSSDTESSDDDAPRNKARFLLHVSSKVFRRRKAQRPRRTDLSDDNASENRARYYAAMLMVMGMAVTYLRGFATTVVLLILVWDTNWKIIVIGGYLLFWGFAATVIVALGRWLSKYMIPFVPLSAPLTIWWGGSLKSRIYSVFIFGFYPWLCVGFAKVVHRIANQLPGWVIYSLGGVWGVWCAVVLSHSIHRGARAAWRAVQDWFWHRRWASPAPGTVDGHALIGFVAEQSSSAGAARVISRIRVGRMLCQDEMTLAVLSDLIDMVTKESGTNTNRIGSVAPEVQPALQALPARIKENPRVLDELGRLAEQVQEDKGLPVA